MKNSILNKYSCKPCSGRKRTEENNEKQRLEILTRTDKGYWRFEENRMKELQSFIRREKTIDSLSKLDESLYNAITLYGGEKSLEQAVASIGLVWGDVSSTLPEYFYRDFKNVEKRVHEFIKIHKRFPKSTEIVRDLKIQLTDISRHGGVEGVRKLMNYEDEGDLIDDRGYSNNSTLEYIVAQYLIKNDVPYRREISPFEDEIYRCDFELKSTDEEIFYVEVWGFKRSDDGKIGRKYNQNRIEKEKLYKKQKLNLVSINWSDIGNQRYTDVQKRLKEIFSFLKGYEFVVSDGFNYISPLKITDEEILKTIMKYSDDKVMLPTQVKLRSFGLDGYIMEIRKRHGSYLNFARMFDKKLRVQEYEWTQESIYDAFLGIVKTNRYPINKTSLKKFNLSGMSSGFSRIYKTSGFTTPKLLFYREYLKNESFVHPEDLKIIEIISLKEEASSRYSEENVAIAKQIMEAVKNRKSNEEVA